MTPGAAGALLGLVAGLGLWLVLRRLPWRRQPTFDDRLAPYLRDTTLPSTLLGAGAQRSRTPGVTGSLLVEWCLRLLPDLAAWLDSTVGGSASIRLRVDQLGTGSIEEVRLEQLVWGGSALGVVLGLGLLKATIGSPLPPAALLLLSLVAGLGG